MARPEPVRCKVTERITPQTVMVMDGQDWGRSPAVLVNVEWDLGNEDRAISQLTRITAAAIERIRSAKRNEPSDG